MNKLRIVVKPNDGSKSKWFWQIQEEIREEWGSYWTPIFSLFENKYIEGFHKTKDKAMSSAELAVKKYCNDLKENERRRQVIEENTYIKTISCGE